MSTGIPHYYYQQRLRQALADRIDRNPRYSVRSFAAALEMSSSALSQILAGKRAVSTKVVDRLLDCLELTAEEQRRFVESVLEEKKQKGLQRQSPELIARLRELSAAPEPGQAVTRVGLDQFRVIADWYHYAILELTFARQFKPDPKWIARELGITPLEARLAVERLLELDLLERRDGTLKKAHWILDTKDKSKTSAAHRKRQRQILEKSIQSLETDPIDSRNHSSLTMCIDPKNIAAAKAKIQKLMSEIAEDLVQGTPEQVYELTVNLFPLQKPNGEKS